MFLSHNILVNIKIGSQGVIQREVKSCFHCFMRAFYRKRKGHGIHVMNEGCKVEFLKHEAQYFLFLDAIASLLSTQAGHFLCKRKDNGDKDGSSTLINKRYNIMRDNLN